MPKVFVSYRREDSNDITGRIYDRLVGHFGSESVFMDVDSIPLGVDFRAYLSDWVGKCDVLIAVVGDSWLDSRDTNGNVRLGQPDDFVTIENSAAIERQIPVIPVLVGQATMPTASQLPDALSEFAYRNAAEVRSGRDFHNHVDHLIRGIDRHFQQQSNERQTADPENESESRIEPAEPASVEVDPPAVVEPTNLGFEGAIVDGMPKGWFNSLGFVGGASVQYDVVVLPRDDTVAGKCIQLQQTQAGAREFGSVMQRCSARNLVGKRVRIEAELRTLNLESWAGLWLRIDSSSEHLFFDNMNDRPIRGTTPWTPYVLEADVPRGSEWLNYGVLLAKNGTLWADNFQVNVRGEVGQWETV
jgi:hypothetical protein